MASIHSLLLEAVQNTVAFALNGIVFYFAGASSVNFAIRWERPLRRPARRPRGAFVFGSVPIGGGGGERRHPTDTRHP